DPTVGLEDEHARDHLVEKVAIVTDDDQRPAVVGKAPLEGFEGLDVEVVRGLVEDEEIGRAREELGENHAVALPAGEGRNGSSRALGAEEKVGQIGDDVLLASVQRDVVAAFTDGLGNGLGRTELTAQRIEVPYRAV